MKHRKGYSWEKRGFIGILTLDNPPANLIEEPEFIDEKFLESLINDKSVKGILIKGAGRHFSAGADLGKLKDLAREKDQLDHRISAGKRLINIIENAEIPVVAAIKGACFGAGFEIALACHIRICSENAMFAFPEINHGLIPGLGGSAMLSDRSGEGRSMEIILSGNIIDSNNAYKLKVVDYVVPAKETESFALKYLGNLTNDRDTDVIRSVMRSIHNSRTMSLNEALEEETRLFCLLARKSLD